MTTPIAIDEAEERLNPVRGSGPPSVYPQAFAIAQGSGSVDAYLADPAIRKLVEFFEAKGLRALKEEDQAEQWYEDWLAYQAEHQLYARLLSPKQYSALGSEFDLLRLTRFVEVFAYFSPAHAYSLQVTFLGLFAILMGPNEALKREAVAALEAGGVMALGISERHHGADLFGNEFTLRPSGSGRLVANGSKYYIGNSNAAAIISILARKEDRPGGSKKRAPFALFALRPKAATGFRRARKIRTLGVRAAFVGEFEVKDHDLPEGDLIAEGRRAWDAVFGTVTLGKFFLGFGSIGICEHAFEEAVAHLTGRTLYGEPVINMPHIRRAMTSAYARLTAMKLYAYRALDYVQASSAADRRYLLFNAIQKAKVSTEGVKVMALLSECMGAKGFESETYFEMALRDAHLIPAVEGSTHVNLGLTAQFIPRYFFTPDRALGAPGSLLGGEAAAGENPYLMNARTGAFNTIAFPPFLAAYGPLTSARNVRVFSKQVKAFRLFLVGHRLRHGRAPDTEIAMPLGQCLATIAYGQLIAENGQRLGIPPQVISTIFHALVIDLSSSALSLAAFPNLDRTSGILIRRLVAVPRTPGADWDFVSAQVTACGKRQTPPGVDIDPLAFPN